MEGLSDSEKWAPSKLSATRSLLLTRIQSLAKTIETRMTDEDRKFYLKHWGREDITAGPKEVQEMLKVLGETLDRERYRMVDFYDKGMNRTAQDWYKHFGDIHLAYGGEPLEEILAGSGGSSGGGSFKPRSKVHNGWLYVEDEKTGMFNPTKKVK